MDLSVLLGRVAAIVAAVTLCSASACSSSREILAKDGSDPPGFIEPQEAGTSETGPDPAAPLCPTSECPAGRVTCPNKPFPCGVDLSTDEDNCGACGVRCRQDEEFLRTFHAVGACANGACKLVCEPGWADCNGNVEDGCETFTMENKDNCGGCGIVCDDLCKVGKCGCQGSATYCPGRGCVQLTVSDDNCGACGDACPESNKPPFPAEHHAYWGCAAATCDQPKCEPLRADCNGDLLDPGGDGCEVENIMADPKNCGGCGMACDEGESCWEGRCQCPCGAPCYKKLNSDYENCGTCGFVCPGDNRSIFFSSKSLSLVDPAHGRPVCEQGTCGYQCTTHWSDCDGDVTNGCETNTLVDPLHCGACGVRCEGVEGQACVNGQCLMKECGGTGETQ